MGAQARHSSSRPAAVVRCPSPLSAHRPARAAITTPSTPTSPNAPIAVGDKEYGGADSGNTSAVQKALIAAVAPVTHIAPADAEGNLVGLPLQSPGVVSGESRSIGACAGFTDARFATTTEVYPDSPRATPQQCNDAQVAAVCSALDYALAHR
ncbi:hypothetical protein G6F40_015036 [Rhizopus arrhizus]|nr:hypothetical protein G6F40_015036 [Rhizopus arrhizus]